MWYKKLFEDKGMRCSGLLDKLHPVNLGLQFRAFYSLPASGEFCHLLMTFANRLDPDQARQNVRPDLDPINLALNVFLIFFFKKVSLEKYQQTTEKSRKITQHAKS